MKLEQYTFILFIQNGNTACSLNVDASIITFDGEMETLKIL